MKHNPKSCPCDTGMLGSARRCAWDGESSRCGVAARLASLLEASQCPLGEPKITLALVNDGAAKGSMPDGFMFLSVVRQ